MTNDLSLIEETQKAINIFKVYTYEKLKKEYERKGEKSADWLAAAIINEIFLSKSDKEEAINFKNTNKGLIEKEILALKENQNLCELFRQSIIMQSLMPHMKKGTDWKDSTSMDDYSTMIAPLLKMKNIGLITEENFDKIVNPIEYITNIKNLEQLH